MPIEYQCWLDFNIPISANTQANERYLVQDVTKIQIAFKPALCKVVEGDMELSKGTRELLWDINVEHLTEMFYRIDKTDDTYFNVYEDYKLNNLSWTCLLFHLLCKLLISKAWDCSNDYLLQILIINIRY